MERHDGLLEDVSLGAKHARQMYYHLLVVVPKDEDKDSREVEEVLGIQRVNVGEKLGGGLLEISVRRRPLKVANLLRDLMDDIEDDGVLLDNIEVLFDKSLKVEPLTLLRDASRGRLVVVMWRGRVEAGSLVYGVPEHPEYKTYPARDLALVQLP